MYDNEHPENVAWSQPDNDERDVAEYLQVFVDKRILPSTDLRGDVPNGYEGEESELYLDEYATEPDGERRFRLRLEHPDSCVSDLSPVLTAREMDSYLRGMEAGGRGDIDAKADHIRTCDACGEPLVKSGVSDYCSTACALGEKIADSADEDDL